MLVYALSWPAPLEMSIMPSRSPSTDSADSRTAWMQSGWNLVADEIVSVCQATDNGKLGVAPVSSPSTSTPRAKRSKSCFSWFSTSSTVSSIGDRTSSVKLTCPGIVFVLPGLSLRMPVEASAWCLVATRWECVMRRAARSSASARSAKGVDPVCASAASVRKDSCASLDDLTNLVP